jgi:LacI family transcriptional regulator
LKGKSPAKSKKENGGRVTIYDVARHAKISHTTVSRVINGYSGVTDKTRLAVASSIKALGYSPNLAAQSLANGQQFVLGLCYSNPTDAYFAEILLGCFTQANLSKCQLVLKRGDTAAVARDGVTSLIEKGVDGIILTPPLCNSNDVLQALASAGIPAALVTSGQPATGFSAVSIDDRKAAREMTQYLLELGHRRIGFIAGHPNHSASEQRYLGFTDAMKDAGLAVQAGQVVQSLCTYQSGLDATESLLSNRFNPTAIFACNEDMALAAMAFSFRKGLDVPGDISIAGFDDTPMASTVIPSLTAVRRPLAEMASEAVRLLIEQLGGERAGRAWLPAHVMMEFSIVKRASTAAPPAKTGRSGTNRKNAKFIA